jgi:uncharacterized RDD family membrane protein YckC
VLRVGALVLSAIPFCAGFVMVLFDGRRRALHDRLVGTVVVYGPAGPSPATPLAAPWRSRPARRGSSAESG